MFSNSTPDISRKHRQLYLLCCVLAVAPSRSKNSDPQFGVYVHAVGKVRKYWTHQLNRKGNTIIRDFFPLDHDSGFEPLMLITHLQWIMLCRGGRQGPEMAKAAEVTLYDSPRDMRDVIIDLVS